MRTEDEDSIDALEARIEDKDREIRYLKSEVDAKIKNLKADVEYWHHQYHEIKGILSELMHEVEVGVGPLCNDPLMKRAREAVK